MTDTTTDTKTTNAKQGWDAAAAASAEAQKPADPKVRHLVEKLPVLLTDPERIAVCIRYADAVKRIKEFDEKTKEIAAGRKADKAKLVAVAAELEDATRTGRVQRDVRVAEYTSFEQNRKWKVRLDTQEQIEEQPLSSNERQAELDLGGDDEEEEDDDAFDDLPEAMTAGDSTTNLSGDPDDPESAITDPAAVLKGTTEESSKGKRTKKKD